MSLLTFSEGMPDVCKTERSKPHRARIGSNIGSSRKRPSMGPFTSSPRKPSFLTVRSNSSAAASGECIGGCARLVVPGGATSLQTARCCSPAPTRCHRRPEVGPWTGEQENLKVIPLVVIHDARISRVARAGFRLRVWPQDDIGSWKAAAANGGWVDAADNGDRCNVLPTRQCAWHPSLALFGQQRIPSLRMQV